MIEKILINKQKNDYYTICDARDGFLICLPTECSIRDFFTAAKVDDNSYGSIMISRLYHGLMSTSQNVVEEYKKYYSNEYESLSIFLFWKYCVPMETSEKIISQLHQNESLFYGKFSSGSSSTARAFIENEIMLKSLKKIVNEIREYYHENQK
ncbi:MAG: hypothetical protein M0Q91_04345 [Methanoregula sp.]|jgi:hypothetical protein|nr:hypothetical protein [Methanoregula sp.]